MASCGDLFLERQRLLKEKAQVDADLMRIKGISMSTDFPSDEQIRKAAQRTGENIESIQESGVIDEAIANPKAKTSETNIPEGQPTNFKQLLRNNPEEVANDYATLSKALLDTGKELRPEDWKFVHNNAAELAEDLAETLGGTWKASQVLEVMAGDSDPFNGLIEKTRRLRWFNNESKRAYIDVLEEIGDFMDNTPIAGDIPDDLIERSIGNFKVSLMSERHYDHARNTWSNMGRAMQGPDFEARDLDIINDNVKALDAPPEEIPSVKEAIEMQPIDFSEEQSIGRVIQAIDLFKSNRIEAIKQLELEISSTRIEGVDPRKRFNPEKFRDRMYRLTNGLAKDEQLFNERTAALDVVSNFTMALHGPVQQTFKNMAYVPMGTTFMQNARDSFTAMAESYGAAYKAVRAAGKELYLDSFSGKEAFYAGSIDTYGRAHKPVEQIEAELIQMLEWKPISLRLKPWQPKAAGYWFDAWRRKSLAGTRLWVWRKSGKKHPALLQRGFSVLKAQNNVAGYWFHTWKLRNALEMKARRSGVQLGLVNADGEIDRRMMNDWINEEFDKQFYSMHPTEKQVKAYRKEKGIPPKEMSDTDVEALIREEKVRETYGAPVFGTQEAGEAAAFSDQMRFQNTPGEGNFGKPVHDAVKTFKAASYLADIKIPYLQAPFMGFSQDMTAIGVGPLKDLAINGLYKNLDPEGVRKLKANMVMAGIVWATFSVLKSQDLIVGNGPVDPIERDEWLLELKRKGTKPNSIGGVQLIGGIPVLNALFMGDDLVSEFGRANYSDADKQHAMDALFSVIAGHLTRQTALGDVSKLMEFAYGDRYGDKDPGAAAGRLAQYTFSGQLPFSGVARTGERILNSSTGKLYRERPWTEMEEDLFDPAWMEKTERYLQELAYGVSGLTAMPRGAYREKDWLGEQIRVPWGWDFKRYWHYRFFPHEYPEVKAYAELNRLNLLNPPTPLMKRTLSGVPMSDDLQKEYNDTYGAMVGDMHPIAVNKLSGGISTFSIKVRANAVLPQGFVYDKKTGIASINLGIFLGPHVKGKTMLQAVRSLMNDPVYKAMEDEEELTTQNRKLTQAQVTKQPAYKMMDSLKNYYHELTLADLQSRGDPSPAVQVWRDRAQLFRDQEAGKEFSKRTGFAEALGAAKEAEVR